MTHDHYLDHIFIWLIETQIINVFSFKTFNILDLTVKTLPTLVQSQISYILLYERHELKKVRCKDLAAQPFWKMRYFPSWWQ